MHPLIKARNDSFKFVFKLTKKVTNIYKPIMGDKNIPLLLNPVARLNKLTDLISLFSCFYSRILIDQQVMKQYNDSE